ncbi:MAG TPA: HSP20 family small heat-shock protein [Solirubrobacteraceae bacterium]|nr:HSP20 family small heat-shock protein [Solirubrobacteraceae bacterium]
MFDPFTFDSFFRTPGARGFVPASDVIVGENDTVITMDLPGLTTEALEVEALDGELVVRGERRRPEFPEASRWALNERAFGAFERRIRLPEGVDPDSISASMTDGVLSLIIPKPEEKRPRTIAIGTGDRQRELETATA